MDWLEQKNKIFSDFYLPLFLNNGFRKRGWEFYKEIEKNKFGIVVKLTSSGYNSFDSASFFISVGLKFNKNDSEILKKSDITLYRCEIEFNVIELFYPEETIELGEYWYHMGGEIYPWDLKKIGDKYTSESNYYGAFNGRGVTIREKISDKYIKSLKQVFDKNDNLVEEEEYISYDTTFRYDRENINDIMRQIEEDTQKISQFADEISNVNNFLEKDTTKIISNKIKDKIKMNYV